MTDMASRISGYEKDRISGQVCSYVFTMPEPTERGTALQHCPGAGFSYIIKQCCESGSAWIRNFCLDPASDCFYYWTVALNREWQVVVKILLFDWIYGVFLYYFEIYLFNISWIRIHMDPELLPGSGTRKIQGWITTLLSSTGIYIKFRITYNMYIHLGA